MFFILFFFRSDCKYKWCGTVFLLREVNLVHEMCVSRYVKIRKMTRHILLIYSTRNPKTVKFLLRISTLSITCLFVRIAHVILDTFSYIFYATRILSPSSTSCIMQIAKRNNNKNKTKHTEKKRFDVDANDLFVLLTQFPHNGVRMESIKT